LQLDVKLRVKSVRPEDAFLSVANDISFSEKGKSFVIPAGILNFLAKADISFLEG